MIYRTNQYKEVLTILPFWDRLSMKLVGHPNLFINIATVICMTFPIWGVGIILIIFHLTRR